MNTTFFIQYLYLTNSLYNKHGFYEDLLFDINPYKTLKNVHKKFVELTNTQDIDYKFEKLDVI